MGHKEKYEKKGIGGIRERHPIPLFLYSQYSSDLDTRYLIYFISFNYAAKYLQ